MRKGRLIASQSRIPQSMLDDGASRPLANRAIRLVLRLDLALCHSRTLRRRLVFHMDVDAAVDVVKETDGSNGLGANVAEHAIAADEVGAPRRLQSCRGLQPYAGKLSRR